MLTTPERHLTRHRIWPSQTPLPPNPSRIGAAGASLAHAKSFLDPFSKASRAVGSRRDGSLGGGCMLGSVPVSLSGEGPGAPKTLGARQAWRSAREADEERGLAASDETRGQYHASEPSGAGAIRLSGMASQHGRPASSPRRKACL